MAKQLERFCHSFEHKRLANRPRAIESCRCPTTSPQTKVLNQEKIALCGCLVAINLSNNLYEIDDLMSEVSERDTVGEEGTIGGWGTEEKIFGLLYFPCPPCPSHRSDRHVAGLSYSIGCCNPG
jgi:hypothetical protein